MDDSVYNEYIDISNFLPANVDSPNILENLYKETPYVSRTFEDFLKIPTNPQYNINKELKERGEIEKEHTENEKEQ